jgi:GntR family transcriptional repressor for pyruvate dehydrogenase complex
VTDNAFGIVPVKQLRLPDAVASQLVALINSGQFGEDGRLPSERELAEQFAVSRGSMREAVRKLEALGIIVKNQGVGSFAVGAAVSAGLELLSAGEVTAPELFEVRYTIEPLAAELSAERRTARDLRDLDALVERSAKSGVTDADFVRLDFEFHRMVAQTAKNRLLTQMYDQLAPHHAIYSAKVISLPERRARAYDGHLHILAAVRERDPYTAREQALAHLQFAENDLITAVEESDPPQ